MKTLLDTNVVSEVRQASPDPRVLATLKALDPPTLYLSSISFGELRYGIARLDAGRKKRALGEWLGGIERDFADRILPFD